MSAQTHWTNKLLNTLSRITHLATGTVYAIPIDASVQNILTARFSYQVNDYYGQLKYYAYYDGNARVLSNAEAAGVDIEHLEKLGAWKPLLAQGAATANIALLNNHMAASFVTDAFSTERTPISNIQQAPEQSLSSNPHS
jgi:hypothetical protein